MLSHAADSFLKQEKNYEICGHTEIFIKKVHMALVTSYQKNVCNADIIHQRRNCEPNESNAVVIIKCIE